MRRRYLRNRARSNIVYPGLIAAWSAKGKSNDDEDKATLKDLTGNGHDITLNGFAFSEMSGYGGYSTDFKKWSTVKDSCVFEKQYNKIVITESNTVTKALLYYAFTLNAMKVKVTGLQQNQSIKFGHDGSNYIVKTITEDGTYDIDFTDMESTKPRCIISGFIGKCNITIELIPEYPDALVFDGVDDYGFCTNIPLLEDYTIIVKRKDCSGGCLFVKGENTNGAFVLEGYNFISNTYNYGHGQSKKLLLNNTITWQNKNSYNQQNLIAGDKSDTTNRISIGVLNRADSRYLKGAFYSAYLFDRSLDEQEIKSFIRKYIDPEYLLPSEIPTPDCYYDFSQGSNNDENRDTIKDYSGNGNDAVAHNFVWNEKGSGYKDGALVFDGVDDYVTLDAFDSGFKTMFMLVKPFSANQMLYDQRAIISEYDYALYSYDNIVAYNGRNINGTYINNKFNNYRVKDVINKKQLIMVKSKLTQMHKPYIACNQSNSSFFADMALYKFLGFKEALTKEQINAIIKKYNLLDGVDEIEVS